MEDRNQNQGGQNQGQDPNQQKKPTQGSNEEQQGNRQNQGGQNQGQQGDERQKRPA